MNTDIQDSKFVLDRLQNISILLTMSAWKRPAKRREEELHLLGLADRREDTSFKNGTVCDNFCRPELPSPMTVKTEIQITVNTEIGDYEKNCEQGEY